MGFRDTPRISADTLNGITLMTVAGTPGVSSVSDVSIGTVKYVYPDIHAAAVDLSDEEIAALQAGGTVRYVEDYLSGIWPDGYTYFMYYG